MKIKHGKNDKAIAILKRSAKLIEKGWARGWFAKDKYGKIVDHFSDPRAVKFCAVGAIRRASNDVKASKEDMARARIALEFHLGLVTYSIVEWNDKQKSKKPVIEAFNAAAESLEKKKK